MEFETPGELLGRGRDVGTRRRGDLEDGLEELRLDLAGVLVGHVGEHRLDALGQVEGRGIQEHQLLLDPDGEGCAVEAVLEHGWVPAILPR